MTSVELRKKFIEFFKTRGHAVVPSSSLVPDDPSVLLTTAGMQQFKKYFTGELDPIKDFNSKSTATIQKCFRTSSIDEVGDDTHGTFFEMLGNFSFGGYFKEEAIKYAYDFITKELDLTIDYVSVFVGDKEVPADIESENIWQGLGVSNIKKMGREDNFWGPTGIEGPCGPSTEIYVKNAAGNSIEIWNLVFNEYYLHRDGFLEKLKTPGVDTGMGLERLAMVVQEKKNIFETDLFTVPFSLFLPFGRRGRIVADHLRGAIFLLADGVLLSNKEQGYILRRLIRRLIVNAKKDGIRPTMIPAEIKRGIGYYGNFYKELQLNENKIINEFNVEAEKFEKTFEKGMRRLSEIKENSGNVISGTDINDLRTTYGFPVEVIKDLVSPDVKLDFAAAEVEFKKHQEISRAGLEKKFGGHGLLLDTGELKAVDERELKIVKRLHTATHLMQAALREVLGPEVKQNGSDITAARTRFDFFFNRKVTPEELKQVEDLVNKKIAGDLPVQFVELPLEQAKKTGALYFFKAKYGAKVKVYYMGDDLETAFSKEFCGGPHVERTSDVGKFKIVKEESASAGIRRIRAVVS